MSLTGASGLPTGHTTTGCDACSTHASGVGGSTGARGAKLDRGGGAPLLPLFPLETCATPASAEDLLALRRLTPAQVEAATEAAAKQEARVAALNQVP